MTCMYPICPSVFGTSSSSLMDQRALMPIDNNTNQPGFLMSGGCSYYGNGGFGAGYESSFGMGGTRMELDLDIALDDDSTFLDDLGCSLHSSPMSQSSSHSNLSTSSNCSISASSRAAAGGGDGGGIGSNNVEAIGRSVKTVISRDDKICGVCGDKALGFNFDAISCESCKAFFRRNAPKGLGYFKCPYDEKCRMDTTNRRFCKRCRLKKCLQIGMKKEYILTDEEKATKRRKIEENRFLKKITISNGSNGGRITQSPEKSSTSPPSSMADNPSSSFASPLDWQPVTEAKWQPMPTMMSATAVSAGAATWLLTTTPLSAEDEATINDLRVAYHNSLIVNVGDKVVSSSRDKANLTDLVNIAELSVRRVIAMVKQVTSFRMLPQVEQIHLLKGGSIELLIIRSVMTFDEEKQHFLDPVDHEETSAMRLDQLERAETGLGLFDDLMKFIRSLVTDLRADETTLILLLVISLFSPDRDNLSWKSLVAEEQEKYTRLLNNYLESIHPLPVARILFPKLLMKLTEVRNLNEEHSQVLLRVKLDGIHPLMKEVLDLTC